MPVLVAIDAVGIQRYVFASNRLRDVVGASRMVELGLSIDNDSHGLVGEVAAGLGTVLIAAGGNAVLTFNNSEHAREFTGSYTRRLLQQVPGLDVAVAHRRYNDRELARALLAVQVDLARAKAELRPSTPVLGLGVTAPCHVTGRPATGVGSIVDEPLVPLSHLVRTARSEKVHQEAQQRWRHFSDAVNLPDGRKAVFPTELDELGRTRGERSLIGVVHVDGNGIGHRINDWLKDCATASVEDDRVLTEYRSWSGALSAVASHALQVIVDRVAASVRMTADGRPVLGGLVPALDFELSATDRHVRLPIRPILLGGDDLTFVCDGRIALDVAATAAGAFGQVIEKLGADPLSACAGVAIVAAHSPFIRAYELAAELCASAKRGAHENGWPGGAIDWHVGAFRPGESVRSIRQRQYRCGEFGLTCRPYPLDDRDDDANRAVASPKPSWPGPTWEWFSGQLLGTSDRGLRGDLWSDRRAKVKALPVIAQDGPAAVERALAAWRVSTSGLSLPEEAPAGFFGGRSPLIDASELLDRMQVLA